MGPWTQWIQVSDLHLALQFSGLVPQEQHPELFFFLDRADWQVSPEVYRDRLIAVGRIIAGDGILPEFTARAREVFAREAAQSVFVVEHDEDALLANMLRRGRGIERMSTEER